MADTDNLPQEDKPKIRPDLPGLRTQEGIGTNLAGNSAGGATDAAGQPSSGTTSSTSASSGGVIDSTNSDSVPAASLRNREESAPNTATPPKAEDQLGSGYNPDDKQSKRGLLKGRVSRTKLIIGGAIGGGLVMLVVLLVIFLGSLEIPNFVANMTDWQFARVARSFSQDAGEITAEKMAIDADEDNTGLINSIKSRYGSLLDNTWRKLDDYRPQKIISNLETDGTLKYNYERTLTGKQRLVSVTFDDTTYQLADEGFFGQFHLLQNFKYKVAASQDFGDALSLSLDGTNTLVRGAVMKSIFSKLGISLKAWSVGKYTGKSQEAADDEQEANSVSAATDDEAVGTTASVGEISNGTEALDKDIAKCNTETKCIKQEENSPDGITPAEEVDDSEAVGGGSLDSITGALKDVDSIASPTYAVALPLCIIYDGSIDKSASTIDQSDAEAIRTGTYVDSAASQQEAGSPYVTGEAVGAMNWKLGNISASNVEIRASGGTVNTSSGVSPEASTGGQYTLFNTIFPAAVANFFSSYISPGCGVLTNPLAGAGTAITSLLGSDEVWALVREPTVTGITSFTGAFVRKFASELPKLGIVAVGTIGLTEYAKMLVMEHAGTVNDGAAVGTTYANQADMGNNLLANEEERDQFFGRPLTNKEVSQDNQASQETLALDNSQKSFTQRYFALDNPDSLFSKVGTDLYSMISFKSFFSSISLDIGKFLNPISSLGHLFSSLAAPKASAATPAGVNNSDYGNVQWGWSSSELNLINNSSERASYQPLENQAILDANPSAESEIASHYGQCYATEANAQDPLNDTIDQSKVNDMGELLANGWIVRDSSGGVVADQGRCSPDNLGPDNTDPNSPCGSGGCGDLVFRWRLAMAYESTLDHLNSVQSASSGDDASE